MDDAFGHWLAGFTDGEAAFVIARVSSRNGNPNLRTWPNCRYEISLRGDDGAILRTIRDTLGYGSLYVHTPASRADKSPAVRYSVHRVEDCLKVVELFTRYPLRAKKRAQFEVWAEAVREMEKGRARSDARMEEYRARLAALRTFAPADVLANVQEGNPEKRSKRKDYGVVPLCLCGCGAPTLLRSNPASTPHPDNPHYSSCLRGHHWRVMRNP